MRTIFAALVAAAAGASLAPTAAEAIPFPVIIDFNYCFGAQTCPNTPIVYFQLEQAGTFTVSDGFAGVWRYSRRLNGVRVDYQNGIVYQGIVSGGCFTDQPILSNGVQAGAWSGCIR
jgi:hypothetical protein